MKRKSNYLIFGILSAVISATCTALFFIVPQSPLFLFIFSLFLLLLSAILLTRYWAPQKTNYTWFDLKERKIFTVLTGGPAFMGEDILRRNLSDIFIIDIEDIGKMLIQFPLENNYWPEDRFPEPGKRYMKLDGKFVKIS